MRLPRWTVYPALALLAVFLITALPRTADRSPEGVPAGSGLPPPRYKRVIVLGIDGFDPDILLGVIDRYPDRTRNLAWLVERSGGAHPLGTSWPPQSPVAWSNFITGRNAGGHGIFDFIHRDPVTREAIGSTTKSEHAGEIGLPFSDWKLPLGGDPESNRSGEPFWVTLAHHGIPADVWRMPANFPVEPAKGVSFPGMMTPTLDSAYGMYTFYTEDAFADTDVSGGRVDTVRFFGDKATAAIVGPPNSFREGDPAVETELAFYRDVEHQAVAVDTGREVVILEPGQWSEFAHVDFRLLPMGAMDLKGVVRFYLRSVQPFELYASPPNFDPEDPATPVSAPESASADLARAIGTYYTQGMAEEVNALKDKVLTDAEFMQQVELVYRKRMKMLDYALDHYLEDDEGGLLFFYFSTIDLSCHMMWRLADPQHPFYDARIANADSSAWSGRPGSHWSDVIDDLYLRIDPVVGRVRERIGDDGLIILMSDHGFETWRRKFSLNTWLLEQGYLVLKEGYDREEPKGTPGRRPVLLKTAVDWTRTRAYGMGFNGLYLNLRGREKDDPRTEDVDESGIVDPAEAPALLHEIAAKLEAVRDDDGTPVVLRAPLATEIYSGERLSEAPDIVVGYNAGYGNSDASSTGRVPNRVLADNDGGTFNGNHLMDPSVVSGVLLANRPVPEGDYRLEDLTVEILRQYGVTPGAGVNGHPVFQ